MPYKCEKKRIPKNFDRRRRLTEAEKMAIKCLYGVFSQRKLARIFGVSRRLIQFIACPDKLKRNLYARKVRGGSKIYYNREKHREYMKKHRKYKQSLNLKGVLEEPGVS